MIYGVKSGKIVDKAVISGQIYEIRNLYGIESHYLETLLMGY